ncbi:RadC family protein [Thermodesulforhabdus norvegica]|uniref:DNA repair protein RadC n=1 Tax=Thermodesulforhabdus norvegica TaxID=39841 RepID=A0A1I4VEF9_9BACT|nr:DNA repair protein RadC [Thermodesulforhabdus norvegica]SFM99597.1 DNA repair protein RadC [Thermodesulforhabdus norvegica]
MKGSERNLNVDPNDVAGHRRRLRERFKKSGLDGFQDYEVLELLLTYVIPRKDVKGTAKRLIREFGSLSAVFDAPRELLQSVEGIGPEAALFLSLIPEVISRYGESKKGERPRLTSVQEAVEFLRPRVDRPYESFWIVALNSRNEVIAIELVQKGSVNRVSVIPRMVVESAIKHKATGIILAHNHPGGVVEPSQADINLTKVLFDVLHNLDIALLDHLIITHSGYFSFAERGMLKK